MRGADLIGAVGATYEPRLARVAAAIADPTRSRMLACLLGGRHAPAGELARVPSVTPSTASGHLAILLDAGLVIDERRGRHRWFALADAEVAHALEALALVAERGGHERRWDAPGRRGLRRARCCYRHLAGELGVSLFDALVREGRLEAAVDGYALTDAGRSWLCGFGMTPPDPVRGRRFAYRCMDWSERRDHLAGTLATALLEHFVAMAWLVPVPSGPGEPGVTRALRLTPVGEQHLLPRLQLRR